MNTVVGIDIGGANLKYASDQGQTHSREFPLWRRSAALATILAEDIAAFGTSDALAVTMTGELADCFIDRADGVQQIVDSVELAANQLGIKTVLYYAMRIGLIAAADAKSDVDRVAASNWHALASFVGEKIVKDAMLIDIGSTTTDLIPIVGGRVATNALTDFDRLSEGSLVYVGCERTPVCALVDKLKVRESQVGVMNEFFATIDDARLVLGTATESTDCGTADGRARTREFAIARLSRMIGLDRRSFDYEDAETVARQIIESARHRISESLVRLDQRTGGYVLSGHGDDLLPPLLSDDVIKLSERLGPELSRCAPAYAVARLFIDSH